MNKSLRDSQPTPTAPHPPGYPERRVPERGAALRHHGAPLLVILLLTIPGLVLATLDPQACETLLGWPVALLGLLYFTLWLPGALWLLSLWLGWYGYRILRSGMAPPPEMPVLFATGVRRGTSARIKGVIWLAAPLYCSWVLLVGLNAFDELSQGRALGEMSVGIVAECQ
ncbi:hypothetical protein [Aestuariirhabdus sp. LZHN29]|uniref:hypothetical protein n=1 Tax=Aestuariirhabdus sp. LZHN29 TaxID=3417462 RepID=UPI003CFA63EB